MDRVDLFRVFLRVVERASFTRAAASLDLPRSTVSAAVQTLERRVGTRLLARSTRRVSRLRMAKRSTRAAGSSSPTSKRPKRCSGAARRPCREPSKWTCPAASAA